MFKNEVLKNKNFCEQFQCGKKETSKMLEALCMY